MEEMFNALLVLIVALVGLSALALVLYVMKVFFFLARVIFWFIALPFRLIFGRG